MIFRLIILSAVSMSLFCCGCKTGTLSASEEHSITIFVLKETGERVVSLHRRADGAVQVQTDITPTDSAPRNYCTRYHLWLLKQAPDSWKLTELGIMTL